MARNAGYSLLPTEERHFDNHHTSFSYNTYEDKVTTANYKSIFTYNRGVEVNHHEIDQQKSPDRILASVCHYFLLFWSYLILIATFPLTVWFCFKKLARHERMVLFRIGRLQPIKGPGFVCILPWIDTWKVVNILIRGFIIPPQQLILKDGSIVEIGGEIRFQVEDVVKSVTEVQDLEHTIRQLGQTLLTDILHQVTLQDIQTDKQTICSTLLSRLKEIVFKWGINIIQVELAYPNVLQNPSSGTGNHCSPLGMLMSSIQSMLQKPDTRSLINQQLQHLTPFPSHKQDANSIHSFMTKTAFPAIMSSGAICSQEVGSIYKLEIEGNQGGIFWLDTKQGRTAVGNFTNDWGEPEVTVILSDEDFIAIITSQMTPLQAYISGKLRVLGDAKLLYGLEAILKKLQTTVSNIENTQHSSTSIRIV